MRKLAAICADVGVEIVPTTRMPGPGQTTARSTLQRILRDHGEGHLIQLLRTFVETENSVGARIDAFAIFAVNDIILAHPEWASSGLRWLEVFDRIDLGEIQRVAKANRDAVPQRQGIATMLFRELSAAFAENHPTATEETNVVPIENDLLYGMTAIARYLEISRAKCQHLVERNLLPTFRMPGSTTRCARKSTLNATWAAMEDVATGPRKSVRPADEARVT